MDKRHWAAIGLFSIAFPLYWFGASEPAAAGFAFAGFIVEAMAWRKL